MQDGFYFYRVIIYVLLPSYPEADFMGVFSVWIRNVEVKKNPSPKLDLYLKSREKIRLIRD